MKCECGLVFPMHLAHLVTQHTCGCGREFTVKDGKFKATGMVNEAWKTRVKKDHPAACCPNCEGRDGYVEKDTGVVLLQYYDWSGEAFENELEHTKPPPKSVVCMECGKRIPKKKLPEAGAE